MSWPDITLPSDSLVLSRECIDVRCVGDSPLDNEARALTGEDRAEQERAASMIRRTPIGYQASNRYNTSRYPKALSVA